MSSIIAYSLLRGMVIKSLPSDESMRHIIIIIIVIEGDEKGSCRNGL
jgi:hypothetical protein